ncbi:hypothetical protein HU200_055284 [Digitaria exilis]|uniref:AB hydrolase-1 domain-containing protein n=1 Tax=Digitaria exilis TaxID=1010633 RepID=A0A835AJT8_9POAL|nr:hypothetical protein HU200_055284 [Digitaria exilis]CAB3478541.1 unnamed protein product [Digitaria exilis]
MGGSKHIVLVHGATLGGWSWFKVATPLRAAGYRVDTPDLAASGVDPRPLREVPTFRDYTGPLLDLLAALPDGDRVVLVGHSLGGLNIALAAELFPDKVAAAVFLCAFMPDCAATRPSHVLEKFVEGKWLDWMDTEMKPQDTEGKLPMSMMFGPRILREKFIQLCSPEDATLTSSLMRVSSLFMEDLAVKQPFTKERYGSVRKVYVVCKEDYAIVEGFQRWMVENNPVDEVKEIVADHMVMLSRPKELVQCLTDITEKYA